MKEITIKKLSEVNALKMNVGTGVIKTAFGEINVKAGDLMHFPVGKAGTYVIKNTSENEKLVYIDFGTKSETDVAHLLDIDSVLITGKDVNGMFKAA